MYRPLNVTGGFIKKLKFCVAPILSLGNYSWMNFSNVLYYGKGRL
jgi:hypothetical protein